MAKGRVKWFNKHNRFGFIKMDHGAGVLVHVGSVEGANIENLFESDRVNIELDRRSKVARIRKL